MGVLTTFKSFFYHILVMAASYDSLVSHLISEGIRGVDVGPRVKQDLINLNNRVPGVFEGERRWRVHEFETTASVLCQRPPCIIIRPNQDPNQVLSCIYLHVFLCKAGQNHLRSNLSGYLVCILLQPV